MAAIVLAAACIGGAQWAADARLRQDWSDLVSTAAAHGLILSGTQHDDWSCLTVTGVTIGGMPFLPNMSIPRIVLRRSPADLFRPSLAIDTTVTLVFPDGRTLDAWSRGVRVVRVGRGWRLAGSGVSAALEASGPDDVTSAEHLTGRIGATGAAWHVALVATDITLPANGAWPQGRRVQEAAVRLEEGGTAPDAIALDLALDWGGQHGRVAFTGTIDDAGLLGGHAEATLGPGWAETLKHAQATGAIDAGEAEAAIGFLGLLQPDGRAPVSFPLTVDAGRVRVGPQMLATLPPFPLAH